MHTGKYRNVISEIHARPPSPSQLHFTQITNPFCSFDCSYVKTFAAVILGEISVLLLTAALHCDLPESVDLITELH